LFDWNRRRFSGPFSLWPRLPSRYPLRRSVVCPKCHGALFSPGLFVFNGSSFSLGVARRAFRLLKTFMHRRFLICEAAGDSHFPTSPLKPLPLHGGGDFRFCFFPGTPSIHDFPPIVFDSTLLFRFSPIVTISPRNFPPLIFPLRHFV